MSDASGQTAPRHPAPPPPPSPAPDTCHAFLIRHGATPASAAEPAIMQGRAVNAPLSAAGRLQAAEVGAFLARVPLAAVYASPMLRAVETATAVAAPHHLAPLTIEGLIEADLGRWEGLTWPQIEAAEPEAFRQFTARPDLHGYGGGETIAQVRDRALPALRDVMRSHLGSSLAIVTHRIVIRASAAELLGVPLAESRRISPSTCGISLLRYRRDKLELISFNTVTHLSAWR